MYSLWRSPVLAVGLIIILTTGVYSDFCPSQYTVSVLKQQRYTTGCGFGGRSGFCPSQYSASVAKTQSYTTGCGWWGRRCTRYRTYYVTEYRTNTRTCCSGYSGSQCNIPICNNPTCANNAVCTAPDKCYCRPGTGGQGCALTYCSSTYDCYPGTCYSTSNCRCASGFSGNNCQTMLEGGTFKSCKGNFERTINGQKTTSVIGKCGKRSATEYTYFSNIDSPDYLHMDYQLYFQNPVDLPPIPSQYIVQAPFGLIGSYVLATLYDSGNQKIFSNKRINCNIVVADNNKPPSASNPHQSLACTNVKYRWTATVGHKYELRLQIVSQTGGFKEKKNPTTGVITKESYTGNTNEEYLNVKFDLKAPVHCTETKTCANEFELPVSWMPDITKLKNPTIVWFGWTDSDSGIKEYRYTVYSMELNSQGTRLTEVPKYLTQAVWLPGMKTPTINLTLPGMYSVILEVIDNAGNIAKSRSILLFDDVNKVEKQEDFPITVSTAEKWDSAFWLTKTSAPVTVNWSQRYINKFHHDNKLLNQIQPMTGVLDDTTGNRTTAAIDNYQGVVKSEVAYNKDNSGGAINKPTGKWIDVKTAQSYTIPESKKDGDTFVVFVRAIDALNNTQEDTVIIHIDTTLPAYSATNTKFMKNAPAKTENKPYISILNVDVLDLHSGIKNISYSIIDTTTSSGTTVYEGTVDGQTHPQFTTPEKCASGDCYCIPLGSCFTTTQELIISNCLFKGRSGHSFKVDFDVSNGAGLQVSGTYNFGIISDLSGIGLYPAPTDLRVLDAKESGTKATIAWNLQPACYKMEGIKFVFDDGGSRRELSIDTKNRTYKLTELKPDSSYTIDVYVLYEGDETSTKSTVSFQTGDGKGTGDQGMGIGVIIAIAIGALVLILLVVVVIALIIRRKKGQPMIPAKVRETTTRIHNRLSRISHFGRDHHGDPEAVFNNFQNQRVHFANGNEYDQADHGMENKSDIHKNMFTNIAYAAGYDEDDDIYIYGGMDIDTSAQWNVSEDRLEIQGPLPKARGKFADLKLATLHDKNGKSTVVAKLNKAGANDEAKLLMTAKMNFLANEIPRHEYIVNFIGAIPPPQGPIILLEYCEKGKLSDWLKQLSEVNSEVEDRLVSFSIQVATGMQHLHQNKTLHRRLGARNVLLKQSVGGELIAKVSGFGPLKGEQGGSEDDDPNKKERVPIKWLAPEQLIVPSGEKREYTPETDVWTFGITLHEIFNKGEGPYPNLNAADLKVQVKNGYRMPRSDSCPEFIYEQVMMPCWESNPGSRPDFDSIVVGMKRYFDGEPGGEYYYDNQVNGNVYRS